MTRPYNLWMLNHYGGNLVHGMEYRHFYLARHLRRQGHRASIVASTFSHLFSKVPEARGLVTADTMDGVEFVWLRSPRYQGNGPMRLANMLSYSTLAYVADLERRLGRPDVILGTSPHPFALLDTLALGRRYQVPTLVEIRDLWPLMLVELGSMRASHPLARVFQWIEEQSFRRATRVISLWHSADRYMFEHGLSPDRYRYLPNGIEPEEHPFDGDHPVLTAVKNARASGCFTVGYAGSHGFANPMDQVIDACALLRERGVGDVHFFMVGDGPSKADAVARAEGQGLTNLSWHAPVSKDVVMAVYRELDACFIGLKDLPLFKYGPTPNKLMDYLLAARPILYAIRSSYDPVADHDLGRSFAPEDGAALADAILELAALSPQERDAMGQAGFAFALAEHSYEALAAKLDGIIGEVV